MGAAGNVGYLLIAVIGVGLGQFFAETREVLLAIGASTELVDRLLNNGGWRLLMMLGAAPALLTFFIRIYVPESSRWERERNKGTTSHWVSSDLIGVFIGTLGTLAIIVAWMPGFDTTPVISLLISGLGFAMALVGFTYPVKRFLARSESDEIPAMHRARPTFRRMILGACLSGVALLGTWGSVQQAPAYANGLIQRNDKNSWLDANPAWTSDALPPTVEAEIKAAAQKGASYTQAASALGAIVGTILAALLANRIGRRITYFILCVGSLAIVPAFFLTQLRVDGLFLVLVGVMGAVTASFYGWLPLKLPEMFRTSVRATGQGFAFNFGRILAAIGVLQLGNLTALFVGGLPVACASLSLVYLLGMILIWFTPETLGQALPE